MSVFRIVEMGEDILRQKAKAVSRVTPNILKLLDNMRETLDDAQGLGLAAPQIGVLKRVVIIKSEDQLIELINPEILHARGDMPGSEGCLSIPGIVGEVVRRRFVRVKALDRSGNECVYEAEGLLARAFQHELDHLEGVLFVDKAQRVEKVES